MKSKQLVAQSNHIIEARYKLSPIQQKIVVFMASLIEKDDVEFREYELDIGMLKQTMGIKDTGFHTNIRQILIDLRKRDINIYNPEKNSYFNTGWIAGSEYSPDNTKTVKVSFHPNLKPYFLQLKGDFTLIPIKCIAKLTSQHSIRIYELLKQYQRIGRRTFDLDKLRAILSLSKDEYPQYKDFKRYVLMNSQKELTKHLDITFRLVEHKEKRKVVRIEFVIKHNPSSDAEPIDIKPLRSKQIPIRSEDDWQKYRQEMTINYERQMTEAQRNNLEVEAKESVLRQSNVKADFAGPLYRIRYYDLMAELAGVMPYEKWLEEG